jgi:pSer/pThr/pTyr-binding forkhead associated (FHA) protein
MRIGRNAHSEVMLDNIAVSRHHATVVYRSPEYLVVDEGSQNGLYVNGQLEDTRVLSDGDTIQVGKFELVFNEVGGPNADQLRMDAEQPQSLVNPEETQALTAEEVRRYLAASEEKPNQEDAPEPAEVTDSSSSTRSPEFYRNLAIGLGTLVLILGGILIFSLTST